MRRGPKEPAAAVPQPAREAPLSAEGVSGVGTGGAGGALCWPRHWRVAARGRALQGGGGFFYYPPGHPAHVPGSLPPNVEGQLRSSVHPMERIAPHWSP